MAAYSTFRHMAVGNSEQVGLVSMWSVKRRSVCGRLNRSICSLVPWLGSAENLISSFHTRFHYVIPQSYSTYVE